MLTRESIHQLPPDTSYGLLRDHVLPAASLPYAIGAGGRPVFRVAELRFKILSDDRRAKRVVTQAIYRPKIGPDRKLGARTLVYAEFVDRATTKVVFEAEDVKAFPELGLIPNWAHWPTRALANTVGYGGYLGDEFVLDAKLFARADLASAMCRAMLDHLYMAAEARFAAEAIERYGATAPPS
jgi:hypothetical protein